MKETKHQKNSTNYKTSWKNDIMSRTVSCTSHCRNWTWVIRTTIRPQSFYSFMVSWDVTGSFSFKTQNRNMFLNYLGWICLQTLIWIFYFLLIFLLIFFIFWSTPTSEPNNEWLFYGAQKLELMGSVGNSGASWPRVQPNLWSAMSQVPLLYGL